MHPNKDAPHGRLIFIQLTIVFFHDLNQINYLVRVANLIVVPRNYLYELVGEVNTGVSIEDRSQRTTEEVRRNNLVFCVTEYTLQFTLSSSLHGVADIFLSSGVLEIYSQVNN